MYKKEGCRLAAVWFRVATVQELKHPKNPTEQVNFHWRPAFEARPDPTAGCWTNPDYRPQEPEDRLYNRVIPPVSEEEGKRRKDLGQSHWYMSASQNLDTSSVQGPGGTSATADQILSPAYGGEAHPSSQPS